MFREIIYPHTLLLGGLLGWLVVVDCPAQAQMGNVGAALPSSSMTESRSLSGQVVNALTGQPVARALVRVGGQAVLADHEGKFEISGLTDDRVYVQVTKPGFYESLDPARGDIGHQIDVAGLDGPLELQLYPEALLTGTVTTSAGDPLAKILVTALRSTVWESGQRWIAAGQAVTDSRGGFRIPVAPGDYAVEIPYLPQHGDSREAVLPVVYPPISSSVGLGSFAADSGTEQHLDLHPDTRPTHGVRFRVESDGAQGFPQLQARSGNQLALTLRTRSSDTPGEFLADLPSGSYVVTGTLAGRNGMEHAEASVTVGDHDVSGGVFRFQTVPALPVEVTVDATAPASTSDAMSAISDSSPPNPQQLGLTLHSSELMPEARNPSLPLLPRSNDAPAFQVAPGRYRLYAQSGGPWYVKSVSAGGMDLLTGDLVVAAGSTGETIQVVVSNQTAVLKGTLKINGRAASASVWLIAAGSSASPLIELQSSTDGSFNRSHLAPGNYLAIGFESTPGDNLLDPDVQQRYSAYAKPFQAAPGETVNLDLDAVPAAELKP